MKIVVFGLGYVGCVSLGCLADNGHEVSGVDINVDKVSQINSGKPTIVEPEIGEIIGRSHAEHRIRATTDGLQAMEDAEVSLVCVGTPSVDSGHLDLSAVHTVARQIGEALRNGKQFHVVAIRSTVTPGTCAQCATIIEESSQKTRGTDFEVVSNPEFLREGSAVKDYKAPPFTVIGTSNTQAAGVLSKLYEPLPADIITTATEAAEILKYVNNSFHALKVSFANEIGNICKELQIDSHEVMRIFARDTHLNISSYYLKPGFAYGGSCLPKDLKALATLAHDVYLNSGVIGAIAASNTYQIERAIRIINAHGAVRYGLLGLAFKDGTDDLRNSPAVQVVESLVGRGRDVLIYDRSVNAAILTGTNKEYIESRVPHLKSRMVSSAQSIVEQSDVIIVANKNGEHVAALQSEYTKPIIDLVRLDEDLLQRSNYYGINW